MTTAAGTRAPLAVADGLAREAFALHAPFCARLGVVGRIRRRRPDVGDLELVVVPCDEPGHHDLFGAVVAEASTRCTRTARSGSAVAPDGARPLQATATPWETTGADTATGAGALTMNKQAPEVDRFRGSSLIAAPPLTPTRGSSDR